MQIRCHLFLSTHACWWDYCPKHTFLYSQLKHVQIKNDARNAIYSPRSSFKFSAFAFRLARFRWKKYLHFDVRFEFLFFSSPLLPPFRCELSWNGVSRFFEEEDGSSRYGAHSCSKFPSARVRDATDRWWTSQLKTTRPVTVPPLSLAHLSVTDHD